MNDDKYNVYDNLNKNISALDTILDEAIRNGNFAKAATNKKNKSLFILLFVIFTILCVIFAILYVNVIKPASSYKNANELIDSENYKEAIQLLDELGDYKDSYSKKAIAEAEIIKTSNVGDEVLFGIFDLDGNNDNGLEGIPWIVVEKNANGEVLLLSKYVIARSTFTSGDSENVWGDSDFRKAVRDSENILFNSYERKYIVEKEIDTPCYHQVYAYPGESKDKTWWKEKKYKSYTSKERVFILSFDEVKKYDMWIDGIPSPALEKFNEGFEGDEKLFMEDGKCPYALRTNIKYEDIDEEENYYEVSYLLGGRDYFHDDEPWQELGYLYYEDEYEEPVGCRPAVWINPTK